MREPVLHARTQVLDEHVGAVDEREEGVEPSGGFEVERDRALVALEVRAVGPADVARRRVAHLHDVGAEVGELADAGGPGPRPREVDDADAVERPVAFALLTLSLRSPPRSLPSRVVDTGCRAARATVADGIGTIVFDNPEKHNAMTGEMLAALGRVTHAFAEDPGVRVVVVRGAGERAFVSGADINQLGSGEIGTPPPGAAPTPPRRMLAVGKPVLALIHGYCIGGGVMVALSADLRICSDDAQFGIPAAKLGVGYPHEATTTLVALVGPGHTAEILFSGRRIDAAEALRIGLVNHVVPKNGLEDYVHDQRVTSPTTRRSRTSRTSARSTRR